MGRSPGNEIFWTGPNSGNGGGMKRALSPWGWKRSLVLPRFLKIRLIVGFGGRNKKVAKMCMYSKRSNKNTTKNLVWHEDTQSVHVILRGLAKCIEIKIWLNRLVFSPSQIITWVTWPKGPPLHWGLSQIKLREIRQSVYASESVYASDSPTAELRF